MAYIIQTERLRIRPFLPEDISETYLGWLNSPDLMAYSRNLGKKHTIESCLEYICGFDHITSCIWAIERQADNKHVGNINAYLQPEHGLADIGILIGQSGHSYGLEAWKGIMAVLFEAYNARKVTGGCLETHAAMKKLMQTSGMIPDGCRLLHYIHGAVPINVVYFAQFSDSFQKDIGIDISNANL